MHSEHLLIDGRRSLFHVDSSHSRKNFWLLALFTRLLSPLPFDGYRLVPLTDIVFLYRSTEKGIFSNDVRLFLTSLSLVVGCWVIESLVASHGFLVPASFTRPIIVAFAMLGT